MKETMCDRCGNVAKNPKEIAHNTLCEDCESKVRLRLSKRKLPSDISTKKYRGRY